MEEEEIGIAGKGDKFIGNQSISGEVGVENEQQSNHVDAPFTDAEESNGASADCSVTAIEDVFFTDNLPTSEIATFSDSFSESEDEGSASASYHVSTPVDDSDPAANVVLERINEVKEFESAADCASNESEITVNKSPDDEPLTDSLPSIPVIVVDLVGEEVPMDAPVEEKKDAEYNYSGDVNTYQNGGESGSITSEEKVDAGSISSLTGVVTTDSESHSDTPDGADQESSITNLSSSDDVSLDVSSTFSSALTEGSTTPQLEDLATQATPDSANVSYHEGSSQLEGVTVKTSQSDTSSLVSCGDSSIRMSYETHSSGLSSGTTGNDVVWADYYEINRKEYVLLEEVDQSRPNHPVHKEDGCPPVKRSRHHSHPLSSAKQPQEDDEEEKIQESRVLSTIPVVKSFPAYPLSAPPARQSKKEKSRDKKVPKDLEVNAAASGHVQKAAGSPSSPLRLSGTIQQNPLPPSPSSPLVKLRKKGGLSFRRKDKSQDAASRHSVGSPFSVSRLGSLSKDQSKGKGDEKKEKAEREVDRPPEPIPMDGEQLVQRCVIIQRDEKGYGLTVSGDNPVFVQSVKENGAAARAGVMQGDRIIKVNGTLVTNSNHIEVVKLIKSGSYVALTLLGRPPGQGGKPLDPPAQSHYSPPPQADRISVSGPTAVDSELDNELKSHKIATIRLMYEQVAEEYELVRQEVQKAPVHERDRLNKDVDKKGLMVKSLEQQLLALTGIPAESHLVSASTARLPPSGLPSPGGTVSSPTGHSSVKGDTLDMIQEDKENFNDTSGRPPHPPGTNPAPWLPSGPRHRKADSMPETLFEGLEDPAIGPKDATVSRSHSDSRKRADTVDGTEPLTSGQSGTASADEIEKLRGDIKMRRRKMMQKTLSLPTSFSDSGAASDQSPTGSPAVSPVPTPARSSEGLTSEMSEDFSVPTERLTPIVSETIPTGLPPTPMPSQASSPPQLGIPHHYQAVSPHQVDVLSMEDEFSTDEEHVDEHGPFSDLNVLKHRAAHTAVFLHYLISNSDPSPLLFYLVTESYSQGNMKEMRKWAYEIYSTFLIPSAPLRVTIEDQNVLASIDAILATKYDKEDSLRTVFQHARHIAQNEISELLADFRNKRALGLGSLYGDHELQDDDMSKQTELSIVERCLWQHFERLIDGDQSNERNKAMHSALATFLKQVGVNVSKNNGALERCPSFVAKDKKMFKFRGSNKKNLQRMGHMFQPQNYYTVTNCNHCQGVIWGIGAQGFQCGTCEYNIHRECFEKVQDQCTRKKKRMSSSTSTSFLGGIIPRKQSNLNPSSIKEAQRLQEEANAAAAAAAAAAHNNPSTTVTSTAVFHLRQPQKDDDDDLVKEAQKLHDDKENARGNISFGRTVSMTSLASPTRSTFYTNNPAAPGTQDKVLETQRTSARVDQMRHKFEGREDSRGPMTPPRSRSPDTTDIDEQKKGSTLLARSESLNKKKESRKSVRRTRSDVQADEQTIKQALNQSGSSSNSSLSRSLDSPSNSQELPEVAQGGLSRLQDDSDIEEETELPPLESTIPKDILKKLKPKEKKRQDVINELFHSEKVHVRHLKVMNRLFCYALKEQGFPSELIVLLFPNIEELIDVHDALNSNFKARRKENAVIGNVAELLLNRFDGEAGSKFRTACATFCQNQSHALDVLRAKQRKDQKFAMLLQQLASNPYCQRFELKDMLPKSMQRLTKYPLLIDSLLKYTQSANQEEHTKLQKALECSKSILHFVNQAVKDCENKQKLVDIQRRMDRRPFEGSNHPVVQEYRNLDLTRRKMMFDGSLTWRIPRQKPIDLHVVLLEDILVLLQKQDDKLVLRCQSTTVVADTKFTHSPIIRLTNLLIRNVATDKRAFFLVSTSNLGPQIYDLVANTVEEKKRWFKYITDAADGYKGKDPSRQRSKKEKANGASLPPLHTPAGQGDRIIEEPMERKTSKDESEASSEPEFDPHKKSASVDDIDNVGKAEVSQFDQPQLIQPNEVVVSDVHLVERAEPVLTPKEKVKQKDELIQQTMREKRKLVAELLEIPIQDFDTIVDMATEAPKEMQDARDLVLASIDQANRLTLMINDGLSVPGDHSQDTSTEGQTDTASAPEDQPPVTPEGASAESITASTSTLTSDTSEGMTSQANPAASPQQPATRKAATDTVPITMPADPVITISNRLNQQLTQLLSILSQREEAEKKLQGELQAAQEQLAALQLAQAASEASTRSPSNSVSHHSRPNSYISVTSSASETGEVATEATEDTLIASSLNDETASVPEPVTPTPVAVMVTSALEKSAAPIAMEKLQVVTEDAQENQTPVDTPSGDDDESFFVDAHSDTDNSNLNNSTEVPAESLDTVSCDTTDTDSTGNTVVGATF